MDYVKVNKDDLIKILKENRDKHIYMYKDAFAGYRTKLIAKLKKAMKLAIEYKEYITVISMPAPKPINHESDYNLAIGMLNMHVEENIKISNDQYRNFILDDWSWKGTFTSSTSSYSSSSESSS